MEKSATAIAANRPYDFDSQQEVDTKLATLMAKRSVRDRLQYKLYRAAKATIKRRYSRALFELMNGTVAMGPFKHMMLVGKSAWSNDIASMLLGEYERELDDLFTAVELARHDVFIDIGSADGYFAVGVARATEMQVIAYELSADSREICRQNAELNGMSHRISLRGKATASDLCNGLDDYERPLVLIDIEGGELDLLDDQVCTKLVKSTLIVENHNVGGIETASVIAERLAKTHALRLIRKASRDPFGNPLLAALAEDVAYMMLSEERGAVACWAVLRPF